MLFQNGRRRQQQQQQQNQDNKKLPNGRHHVSSDRRCRDIQLEVPGVSITRFAAEGSSHQPIPGRPMAELEVNLSDPALNGAGRPDAHQRPADDGTGTPLNSDASPSDDDLVSDGCGDMDDDDLRHLMARAVQLLDNGEQQQQQPQQQRQSYGEPHHRQSAGGDGAVLGHQSAGVGASDDRVASRRER